MKELIENLLRQGVDSLALRARVFEFTDEVLSRPESEATLRLSNVVPRMSPDAWEMFQTTLGLLAAGYDMDALYAMYLNLTDGVAADALDASSELQAIRERTTSARGTGAPSERAYFLLREAENIRATAAERGEMQVEMPTELTTHTRDDLGKARQLMAIEMRFITASTRTVPGQADDALIDELKGIEAEYSALLEATPPRFPMYSVEDLRARIATTQEQIGAAFEVMEDYDQAATYYEHAAHLYAQVWRLDDAERTGRAARHLRQSRDRGGVTGELVEGLMDTSTPSLERARLLLDLADRRVKDSDSEGATAYLSQMQHMLDTLGQPSLTPQELAESVADSLGQVAAGDLRSDYAVHDLNRVRRLWQRYHGLLAALSRADSDERTHHERMAQTLDIRVDARLLKLRARLDAVSAALARRQADGAAADDLLATVDAIAADARDLDSVEFDVLALMRRADVLLALDRPREAIEGLEMASALLGNLREYDLGIALRARLAAAYRLRGEWDVVSALTAEGIRLVEKYRYRVLGSAARQASVRSRAAVYGLAAEAAAARGDLPSLLEIAELAKCRVVLRHPQRPTPEIGEAAPLLNRLRASNRRTPGRESALRAATEHALWEQVINARYQTRHGADLPVLSTGAVQAALPRDAAVLYYYWAAPDELFIITLDSERIALERREHTVEQHTLLMRAVRLTTDEGRQQDATAALAALADYLLPQQAGAALLDGKHRLLISPHHRLHAVPFGALPYGGEPLARRYALTAIPGVSVLLLDEPGGGEPVLVVPPGDGAYAPLGEACQRAGRPVTLLEGDEPAAALRGLAESGALAGYGLMVLGSSPQAKADPPALRLADDTVDAIEVAEWALDADAVVLPNAAAGGSLFGAWRDAAAWSDRGRGLEEALQAAGARAVVSALWPADGPASRAILQTTITLLAEGQPAPDALHAAVNGYLAQTPEAIARPWAWAGLRVTQFAGADEAATQAADAELAEPAAPPDLPPEPLPDPDAVLRDVAARVHDPAAAIYQRYAAQQEAGGLRFAPAAEMVEYTPLPYRPDAADSLLLPHPTRLIVGLEVGGQVLRAGIELYGDVILGRGESGPKGIIVDLTPYHGIEAGVSRQHMIISPGDGYATVMDLGSTNGTVLDGVELEPFEEARLTGRHRLRLSDLSLVISVVE